MESISNADSQLRFVLKKQNPKIWWSRLTAQPQKQNWIHVSFILVFEYPYLGRKTNQMMRFYQINGICLIF